jgi:hypothetical protein
MARAARQQIGQAIARTVSVPSPVGGLDAVSNIAAMPPENALILDNWFPQTTFCQLRNGYTSQSTGLPAWVETLMGYTGLTGTDKLFGISGTAVYDCTTVGAVGSAVVTSLTNARWEWVNVGIPGGAYLYAANGVDKPLLYSGSAWVKVDGSSTPAITGVTTTTLRNPAVWKNRVWFVQTNTTLAWYLPVQSVGGAASSFDLATQFTRGGNLSVIMTFSLSSANSFDDFIGFLSSEGELIVYQGTDPSTPGDFLMIGRYFCGRPIGRRCWFKYGADAVIICTDGLVSVTKLISVGIQQPQNAISYNIQRLINNDIQAYSQNFGWEAVVYPLGNKVILNVPQNTNSAQHQYVMNTINAAWCSYGLISSPWNAATFCVLGDNLYWGGNGVVQLADTGQSDGGAQILGTMQPAYSYVGTDRQKFFTQMRPLIQSNGTISPGLALNVDFQTVLPTTTPSFSGSVGSPWNTSPWNTSPWAAAATVQKDWQTVGGIGFSATCYLTIASNAATVNLLSLDYVYQTGGVW